jgi:single-strand DNA-binding protein
MYLNKVILYGTLGRDPELKALPSGQSVVSFSMATTRTWKDQNGVKQEDTQWHNLVCFGKRGEVLAQYVKKGDRLYVEGYIQTRSWEKDGAKQYRTEIIIDDFQFGERKAGAPGATPGAYAQASYPKSAQAQAPSDAPSSQKGADTPDIAYPTEEINPDDIPF